MLLSRGKGDPLATKDMLPSEVKKDSPLTKEMPKEMPPSEGKEDLLSTRKMRREVDPRATKTCYRRKSKEMVKEMPPALQCRWKTHLTHNVHPITAFHQSHQLLNL
jgi:hypothetical protein